MTSKIDEIILKLQNFDYRKILPESTSPSYKSVSSSHFRTHSHKKSMSSQKSELSVSQKDAFKVLRMQLSLQKKKARIELQKKSDKIDQDIKIHMKELAKINKNLKVLENKAESVERIVKDKQGSQLEAFRSALKPLEFTANTIIEEKKELIRTKQDLLSKISQDSTLKLDKTEEFQSLSRKKTSLSSEKESLKKDLEFIKNTENLTYREYFQEQETKKILQMLKTKKLALTENIKNLDKKISENEKSLEKVSKSKQSKLIFHSSKVLPIDKEIQDIEIYLNILCNDLSITPLKDFLSQQLFKQGVDIEGLIIKQQYLILEEKEIELKESWNCLKEDSQNKIRELSAVIDEQDLELMTLNSNSSPDCELEILMKKNQLFLQDLRVKLEKQHKVYQAQQSVIFQWKEKHRKVLLLNEVEKVLDDSQAIEAFKVHIHKNIIKPDHWKVIETVIDKYSEKLREKIRIVDEINAKSEIDLKQEVQIINENKEIQAHINLWTSEKEVLQNELTKLLAIEKITLKKFENFKIESDIERRKNIEKIILENSSLTKSNLMQIQKTYGQKALNRHKEKEKEEVIYEDKKRKESTRKKIQNILSNLAELDNLEIGIETQMNEKCKIEVGRADENLGKMKEKLQKIEEKILILTEAEEDLNEKLNLIMEEKKKDIYRSLHKTLRAYGSQEDLRKVDKLKEMKEERELALSKLNNEKEKLEEEFLEKVKEIEIEEIKLKIKLSSLKNNDC
jgi:hypothetical protein